MDWATGRGFTSLGVGKQWLVTFLVTPEWLRQEFLECVVVHLTFQLFQHCVPLPRLFWLRFCPGRPCYRRVICSESTPLGAFCRGVLGQGPPSQCRSLACIGTTFGLHRGQGPVQSGVRVCCLVKQGQGFVRGIERFFSLKGSKRNGLS